MVVLSFSNLPFEYSPLRSSPSDSPFHLFIFILPIIPYVFFIMPTTQDNMAVGLYAGCYCVRCVLVCVKNRYLILDFWEKYLFLCRLWSHGKFRMVVTILPRHCSQAEEGQTGVSMALESLKPVWGGHHLCCSVRSTLVSGFVVTDNADD